MGSCVDRALPCRFKDNLCFEFSVVFSIEAEVFPVWILLFDQGDLPSEAFKWERAVDELAEADEDLAEYVTSLEKTRDENDEATGDTIASEVEQFLRDADEER